MLSNFKSGQEGPGQDQNNWNQWNQMQMMAGFPPQGMGPPGGPLPLGPPMGPGGPMGPPPPGMMPPMGGPPPFGPPGMMGPMGGPPPFGAGGEICFQMFVFLLKLDKLKLVKYGINYFKYPLVSSEVVHIYRFNNS